MLLQLWHEGALRTDGQALSPSGLAHPGRESGRGGDARRAGGDPRRLRPLGADRAGGRRGRGRGPRGARLFPRPVPVARHQRARRRLRRARRRPPRALPGRDRRRDPRRLRARFRDHAALLAVEGSRLRRARGGRRPRSWRRWSTMLREAGVDALHCSNRRFWEGEWDGDRRNLAGWTKAISGLPTITVGSVGLDTDVMTTFMEGEGPRRARGRGDRGARGAAAGGRVRPRRGRPRADRRSRFRAARSSSATTPRSALSPAPTSASSNGTPRSSRKRTPRSSAQTPEALGTVPCPSVSSRVRGVT